MYEHILAPTDGSELATVGVVQAVRLAKTVGARLTILTVSDPASSMPSAPVLISMGERTNVIRSEHASDPWAVAHKILEDAAGVAGTVGMACETAHVVSEKPHNAIVKAAATHGCDLIVMATHLGAGIGALLMGSETAHVVRNSSVPVLVVPHLFSESVHSAQENPDR